MTISHKVNFLHLNCSFVQAAVLNNYSFCGGEYIVNYVYHDMHILRKGSLHKSLGQAMASNSSRMVSTELDNFFPY